VTRSPRSRKLSAPAKKVGPRNYTVMLIGIVFIVVALVGVGFVGIGLNSGRLSKVLNATAAAFNKESNVEVVISGAGRPGSLSVGFDGAGNYESVVSGTDGGTLLDVGGNEYIKASEAALYATLTGQVPLPVSRALQYSKEYANEWINMTGAPRVSVSIPAHTSGSSFFEVLGGGSSVASVSAEVIGGVPSTVIKNAKVAWVIDSATSLPETFSEASAHGALKVKFFYGTVATLVAPDVSVIPPAPVNTSLSPKNYPSGLSAFGLVYTEIQQTK
jgi:hypothetical protein